MDTKPNANTNCRLLELPQELAEKIIARLNAKEVVMCTSTSSRFYKMIKEAKIEGFVIQFKPSFQNLHRLYGYILSSPSEQVFDHVSANFVAPDHYLVGSCGGLLCSSNLYNNFRVFNPFTRQITYIPPFPPANLFPNLYKSPVGFGMYNEEFFIVVIVAKIGNSISAWMYTARQGWNPLPMDNVPLDIGTFFSCATRGRSCVFANSPYWVLERHVLCFSGTQFLSHDLPVVHGKSLSEIWCIKNQLVGFFGNKIGVINPATFAVRYIEPKPDRHPRETAWLVNTYKGVITVLTVREPWYVENGLFLTETFLESESKDSNGKDKRITIDIDGVCSVHSHIFNLREVN